MPGIVGLITKLPRKEAERELQCMLATLCHESFYATGTWIEESLGVYVGWALRDKPSSDELPLRTERGDVSLIFSGEEFPEPGTARCLKDKGHIFQEDGRSYLVHLYEDDPAFPLGLNGKFHGLLADTTRGTAMLFNDRCGLHRVYYHESKEAFYFSTEAKSILKVRPELRIADPRGMGEFISCGCVLENRTLFKGIYILPPGSAWIFRGGTIERKDTYFHPQDWENQEVLDPEAYYQELREVFSKNLPRYFDGPQTVGMSLTGGLDTRAVMAWRKAAPGTFPCYTFGGMYRDCRDVTVARKVAAACRQPYDVMGVGQDFLSRFSHYAERSVYLTDGGVDVSRSPDLYVNERARKIAPVRMTGLYGDEVLRHLPAFKSTEATPGLFSPEILAYVGGAKLTYSQIARSHPLTFAAFQQAPWYHYGILSLEQTQLAIRSPFLDNDLIRTVYRAPASVLNNNGLRLRLIADGNPALLNIATDVGFGGRGGLSGAIARKYQWFTFKAEYAYDYGMPQAVAQIDHLFSALHFERLFLGRHKFYHFRLWYRDELSEYVREMLLDPRSLARPYIERKGLEAMVREHLKGNRNHTPGISNVLTLELVHRLFLDSN